MWNRLIEFLLVRYAILLFIGLLESFKIRSPKLDVAGRVALFRNRHDLRANKRDQRIITGPSEINAWDVIPNFHHLKGGDSP